MSERRANFSEHQADRLMPLGQILLTAGVILLIARGLNVTTRFSGLPAFWSQNDPTWIMIGIGMTGFGAWILWYRPNPAETGWHPSEPGQRFQTALLYVGEGCHLCHDAADLLARYQSWLPVVQTIDIRSDHGLTEKFCQCIPVLVLDGKIRFRGKIQETLLRRLIEGTPPLGGDRTSKPRTDDRDVER